MPYINEGDNQQKRTRRCIRPGYIAAWLVFFLPLFLAACSEEDSGKVRPVEFVKAPVYEWSKESFEPVVIWTRDLDLDRVFMQRAFARYKEFTGNQVRVVTFAQEEFADVVAKAFRHEGERPDIFLSFGGVNLDPYDPASHCYDFSSAPWVKDLTASAINQSIYKGKVVGLPHWESSISGIIYNKTLFEQLNLKLPTTQAEFLDVCKKIKDYGVTPIYLPYKVPSMMLYQFPLDSVVENPEVLAGLNNGTLSYADIPAMAKIVQWYRTMADLGYFGENYQENDWAGMSPALAGGRYAMLLGWDTWLYSDFQGDPSRFGLMPAFMGVPEQGTFEGPNQALLIVSRHSPRLEAALNLITFMADPYNYNVAFEGMYTAPVFKNQATSISTPQYVAAERLIENCFRDSTAWLRIRGFSQMDAAYIQRYMTAEPGYTLEQCLKDMDKARTQRMLNSDHNGSRP